MISLTIMLSQFSYESRRKSKLKTINIITNNETFNLLRMGLSEFERIQAFVYRHVDMQRLIKTKIIYKRFDFK